MDPFEHSRVIQTIHDERVQHTFQPSDETLSASPSSSPAFGRLSLAPIAAAWHTLLTTLAVRPRLAGHRS